MPRSQSVYLVPYGLQLLIAFTVALSHARLYLLDEFINMIRRRVPVADFFNKCLFKPFLFHSKCWCRHGSLSEGVSHMSTWPIHVGHLHIR